MILLAYRHGLRAAELVDLHWTQVDLGRNAALHVRRIKAGLPSVHPLQGDEMRALRKLHRDQEPKSACVFCTERGASFTPDAVNRLVKRLGNGSKLFAFPIHFHMLRRHSCGLPSLMPVTTPEASRTISVTG
jgi:type 1 fimbriae regulatory protein FimB